MKTRQERMQERIDFLRDKLVLMRMAGLLSPEDTERQQQSNERQFARALAGEKGMADFSEMDVYLNAVLRAGFSPADPKYKEKNTALRTLLIEQLGRTSLK